MRFPTGAVAAAAALVFLSLPVHAQGAPSSVWFDGVGFSYDQTLGTSVNITQVPGEQTDVQQPGGPEAPHIVFSLYGPKSEGARIPRPDAVDTTVRFYRLAALAGYDEASQEVQGLQTLLADRPDLATYTAVAEDGSVQPLPYLPPPTSGQALHARATYVDTPQLSGVASVTAFRSDVSPFDAQSFFYTFQGISADGTWYVAVDVVLDASMFPKKLTRQQENQFVNGEGWTTYISDSTATLDAAAPEAFDPPLTSIDALIQSISFEASPATAPSPVPATSPLASPAAG